MTPFGARRRIRVVQVVLDLEAGGLERVVADLARRLDPERFEVHILALRYLGRNAKGLEPHAALHIAPPLPAWTMIWPRPLETVFRKISPDIVHSHSGAWYKSAIAASHAGIRGILHTEHGRPEPDAWIGRAIEFVASGRTDVLISVSSDLANKMRRWTARRCRIEAIPNGVETDFFAPSPRRREARGEFLLPVNAPVIGCVARLDPIKDFATLIEAIALLRRDWAG